ncbi:SDR family oxidoreductase [Mycetocola miduiensis]|uniref:NAD(P)-dependent dehydrogenase, short-chain alcohol dehydrogenase family n=1 Tax=Mycetocola miduiensis TaxID=995034 RepID=A0A1I4YEZ2_9MICO|nr:SDR family oxidoreductase [Mycetocola miduiensis]SFN36160.1 NAD(P)-dependent dehydrogenase, short-chain alcohol dehydrogenase family [Mycetocola miduiensis]
MFEDLDGRTAVITGGARGLGYSLATALARQGMRVALLDVLPSVEESAVRLAAEYGVEARGWVVDVTDPDAVEAVFAEAEAEMGAPSVLITAAGITIWGESVDVPADTWKKVIAVNLDGTFFSAQAFARRALAAAEPASVIFISSMSGFIVNEPQFQASYNSSKAAVSHLATSLAVEWASGGIRVNAIAPGYFLSDMTREFTEANPELAEQWIGRIPAGRMGEPEDLHGLVTYLASESSSYLTGQSIVIDGGYTAV